MYQDNVARALLEGEAEDAHGIDQGGIDGSQADELQVQDPLVEVEAHDPEVLAVEVQLFLAAEHLLHDRVDVLGALDLDFLVVSQLDVHLGLRAVG